MVGTGNLYFLDLHFKSLIMEAKMAGFDKSLDKELFSKTAEFERSRITVAVFAYNNGTPKLQLSRETKSADGDYSFAKLGRLLKSELEVILPLMEEAKKHM